MSEAVPARYRHGSLRTPGMCRCATVGEWLAANSDLPRLDAELLVAHVLKAGRAQVIAFPETRLRPDQSRALDRFAGRLRDVEPLAYIVGTREFHGIDFRVHRQLLVPRPETELLVELAARLAAAGGRVIDLGTGSGCIAVALARQRPDLAVFATDISLAALRTAASNAAAAGTPVTFLQGDWFDALGGAFDCILANPPYIAEQDPVLTALRHEPRDALVAGADGLAALNRIVEQAPERLSRGGCLILEHGCDQGAAVRSRLAALGFGDVETHRDLAGHERATTAFWGIHGGI